MDKQRPKIFRDGAIAASVWERTGSRGRYHELTLSRSFRQSGDEGFGYSGCFRERDTEALKRCIEQAAHWMRGQHANDDQADQSEQGLDTDTPQGEETSRTKTETSCGE